jgi:hypothetical protein
MSESIAEFVRNGVTRYAEAQRAVSFFREQVFEIVEPALKGALADGVLVLAEKPDLRRQAGDYDAECWLSMFANATASGRPVRIEVGVHWSASADREKAPCIVYANLRDGEPALVRFKFAPTEAHPRVREIPTTMKLTRLCVTVGAQPDLAADVTDVLAALRGGVSAALERAADGSARPEGER